MWNLSGDDIQRAKEELKGRRAAIQARYESDLKQLEADIADLETFETFAQKFVADFKPADASAPAVEVPRAPEPVAEAAAQPPAEAEAETAPAANDAEAATSTEPAAGQRSSSRWRMRLNTNEATP